MARYAARCRRGESADRAISGTRGATVLADDDGARDRGAVGGLSGADLDGDARLDLDSVDETHLADRDIGRKDDVARALPTLGAVGDVHLPSTRGVETKAQNP